MARGYALLAGELTCRSTAAHASGLIERMVKRRRWRVVSAMALSAALVATVRLVVSGVFADDRPGGPTPAKLQDAYPQPTFASPDEQLQSESKGKADWAERNDEFRKSFIASGQDIHALPETTVRTQRLGDGTLPDTVQRSAGVIRATVVAQSVEIGGYIASTLKVTDSIDGTYSGEVVLLQNGGPVLLATGPALAHDDANPILRPGREYILFIRGTAPPNDGKYTNTLSVAGPGNVYEMVDGTLRDIAHLEDYRAPLDGVKLTAARGTISATITSSPSRAAR